MALRWRIVFPLEPFLSLLANTRDGAGNADLWRMRKGTFSPPRAFFCTRLLPTPVMQCWQSLVARCCKAFSFPLASSKGREGLQHCASAGNAYEYVMSHTDVLCLLSPALSHVDIRHAQFAHSFEAAASLWEITVFSPLA